MTTYTVHEAKTHLSKLIERAERGEEVIIARGDKPAVRIEPVEKTREDAEAATWCLQGADSYP
jgi:prevent-host-death family protein